MAKLPACYVGQTQDISLYAKVITTDALGKPAAQMLEQRRARPSTSWPLPHNRLVSAIPRGRVRSESHSMTKVRLNRVDLSRRGLGKAGNGSSPQVRLHRSNSDTSCGTLNPNGTQRALNQHP